MILLFILGLLALFSLVAVTFVAVSRIHRRGAHHASLVERTGDSPQSLMSQAALQVARGTNNPRSSIGPHSLLEDIYGHGGFRARIQNIPALAAQPSVNGQPVGLIDIPVNTNVNTPVNVLDTTSGYYVGRVLTVISGACAGTSARIVDYRFTGTEIPPGRGSQGRFRVLWPKGATLPADNDLVVVNGAPFSGTGFGLNAAHVTAFDPLTQVLLDRTTTVNTTSVGPITDVPWALIPNAAFFPRTTSDTGFDAAYFGTAPVYLPAGPGGANEDYDAPDYQNMLLALRLVDPTGGINSPSRVILPSLHRPELIRYWVNRQGVTDWKEIPPELMRRIMLRPLGREYEVDGTYNADHPNFDGSNPNFDPVLGMINPTNYFWDVDNDGDGRPDSIWVDIGLPVQTAPDGRKYKPLAAILCEDLDGKLNLNAHGNLNQLVQGTDGTLITAGVGQTPSDSNARAIFADGGTPQQYPVGQGYGPAEVNLNAMFGNAGTLAEYEYLLTGQGTSPGVVVQGRYGERDASLGALTPSAGRTIDTGALSANTYAELLAGTARTNFPAWLAHYYFPDDHFNMRGWTNRLSTSFGTPPDLDGDGILGIDPAGNMFYPRWSGTNYNFGMGEWGDKLNNPYQIDLYSPPDQVRWDGAAVVTTDARFQPIELERLLRFNDVDASTLSSRLYRSSTTDSLTYDTFDQAAYRHMVTTESWDLPVPSIVPTADLASPGMGISVLNNMLAAQVPELHLADLIRARSQRDAATFAADGATPTDNASYTLRDLGIELWRGLKFDLNRPFGDGRDQNQAPWNNATIPAGDGVVDDPGEAQTGETIWDGAFVNPDSSPPNRIPFDHANNNTAIGAPTSPPSLEDQQARQEYAKNLYVLMMLVLDQQFAQTAYAPYNIDERTKLATQVAQWAVNVVDFRDADSIMTSFRFDVLPFTDENGDGDPWDVDQNLTVAPPAGVQFGVVWGVERPELLLTETLALHDRRTEDLADDDSGINNHTVDDMDNPDPHYDQRVPPQGSLFVELYNPWSRDTALAGELYNNFGRPTAEVDLGRLSPVGNSPVWRLMITRNDRAPDRRDDTGTWNNTDIERAVYFVDFDPTALDLPGAIRHHLSVPLPSGIAPGTYAVIGPEQITDAGLTTANRQFHLTNAPANFFAWEAGAGNPLPPYNNQSDDPTDAMATIRRVLAVPVDRVDGGGTNVRLSVSEPPPTGPGAYPAPDASGAYPVPLDIPLDHPDSRADLTPADQDILWGTGTTSETQPFRYVHLQRLANPLLQHDDATNPYLTIDTMPIDLSVYNSASPTDHDPSLRWNEPLDMSSRQRAGSKNVTPPTNDIDIWSQATNRTGATAFGTDDPQLSTPTDAPRHTLGFLNESFLVAGGGSRITQPDGFNLDPYGTGIQYNYTGMPSQRPFASFHWPNRPFINQYELLHVPSYSSAWLLAAHWVFQTGTTTHYSSNALADFPTVPVANAQKQWYDNTAFRHLMPWMLHTTPSGAGIAPHLYRALEYMHVPSHFAGADEVLNPAVFQYSAAALDPLASRVSSFHPPYNKVSRYREPGKVNLNTIFDDGTTWQALTNDYPVTGGAKPFWNTSMVRSRAGYDTMVFPFGVPNPASPTMFANPFRSSSGNLLVPINELAHRDVNAANPRHQGIDFTLLRPNPTTPNLPLLAETVTTNPATDPQHNSYFQYQVLTKLGNNVTTRSNVYAVWITLGYFEVERVAVSDSHPDGWQLGRELGADSGEIKRHRSFYLIDRSIPVGFERGEDLNVLDCFLIQRFIE